MVLFLLAALTAYAVVGLIRRGNAMTKGAPPTEAVETRPQEVPPPEPVEVKPRQEIPLAVSIPALPGEPAAWRRIIALARRHRIAIGLVLLFAALQYLVTAASLEYRPILFLRK